MKLKRRNLIILLLGLLSAIGPFSIDMYLPGFLAIAKDLGTTVDMISYSLSSFFIGVSIGQLICGPLLDKFGRKKPLYVGLVLYILSSIGCALSTSVSMLIFFRFFQALGGCVGMVAPRAIIRDLFPVSENAKIFSWLILILGVSPIIAPTAGSFIVAHIGWNWVFVLLAVITLAIGIAVYFWLPESGAYNKNYSLKPLPIARSFWKVLKQPQFYTYAAMGGISSAGLFAYLSGSPFVFMEFFKATGKEYGAIFAIIAAGLITCSQLNNLLLKKYTSQQIIRVTLTLQTVIGVILFAGSVMEILGMYGTIVLMAGFLSCQGFSFPNSAALSMAPFKKDAGAASALMGAMQMGFGALASTAVGLLKPVSPVPMTGIMAACAVIAMIVLFIGGNRIKVEPGKENLDDGLLTLVEDL